MPETRTVARDARRRARVRAVRKAKITVNADAHAPMAGLEGPKDYRKEEEKRLKLEVAALEKELANFNVEKAAQLVRQTLELELKRKKLRLEENALEMTA